MIGASRPILQLADEHCITDGNASTADQFMDALMLSTSAADVGTSHWQPGQRLTGDVLGSLSLARCALRGYRGGSPTAVQAWQPCPLWELSPGP